MNNIHIDKLNKKNESYVNYIIQSNKKIYGTSPLISKLKEYTFYEVNYENKLVGFFSIGNYYKEQNELVIAYVYIKKAFRRKGYFKKIIKYSINVAKEIGEDVLLDINASVDNNIANNIYRKLFKYMGKSRTETGEIVHWYNVYSSLPKDLFNHILYECYKNSLT